MYFLIDYENVNNAGMQGTRDLFTADHVILFYSSATPNMEFQHLQQIKESGCTFEVCKLQKTRKNALDFYIVTRLGEIFGQGYTGSIAIISRDEGFHSVKDYWACCAVPPRQVLISDSIERSIISANEPNQRTALIHKRLKMTDIGNFYSAYSESQKLKNMLDEVFADTQFSARTQEIEELLKSGKTAKVLYLNTLHHFGRKDGLAVYQMLKRCADF